ncbi:hypothetical protein scyTo_0019216, partial [Scyliorhinus torazame]|nr:hypothetical protein [Scyliorhinus torazame]
IERNGKRGAGLAAPGEKERVLKPKKKKEVLCQNSSGNAEGQNGDSAEGEHPDLEKGGRKSLTLKRKKAALETRQDKDCLGDEGCVTKPGKINDKVKVKRKTKCIGGITKTNQVRGS